GQFLYQFSKIPTGRWTLVMRVTRSEIEGPVWSALYRVLGISIVGLSLCLVVLVWLAGSVARPVATAANVASRVAAGDLTASVEATGPDETGPLLRATRTMVQNLNGLIRQGQSPSIQVNAAAPPISGAA